MVHITTYHHRTFARVFTYTIKKHILDHKINSTPYVIKNDGTKRTYTTHQ